MALYMQGAIFFGRLNPSIEMEVLLRKNECTDTKFEHITSYDLFVQNKVGLKYCLKTCQVKWSNEFLKCLSG